MDIVIFAHVLCRRNELAKTIMKTIENILFMKLLTDE